MLSIFRYKIFFLTFHAIVSPITYPIFIALIKMGFCHCKSKNSLEHK
jgi:hypothetical protein